MNFKRIPYDNHSVNLLKEEHHCDAYLAINPSGSVPLLVVHAEPDRNFTITQSIAALEYLEEAHPDSCKLLPKQNETAARSSVRVLMNIVACDIQPPTNLRILNRVRALGGDATVWALELMVDGLAAYEAISNRTAGRFSVGDEVTLADICLVPALWNAQRYGVDLSHYPTISRVFEHLKEEEAVVRAHWKNQPDTPQELRLG